MLTPDPLCEATVAARCSFPPQAWADTLQPHAWPRSPALLQPQAPAGTRRCIPLFQTATSPASCEDTRGAASSSAVAQTRKVDSGHKKTILRSSCTAATHSRLLLAALTPQGSGVPRVMGTPGCGCCAVMGRGGGRKQYWVCSFCPSARTRRMGCPGLSLSLPVHLLWPEKTLEGNSVNTGPCPALGW